MRALTMFSLQNADLIISQIDPSGVGLLSFGSFCRGVAALMSKNGSDVRNDGNIEPGRNNAIQ